MKKTLFLLSLLSACTRDPVLLRVGQYTVHRTDAEYRNRVIRVYYPQETRELGLTQLQKAFLFAEILKNNGRPLTENDLKQEEDRIEKTTLMPELLGRIKEIFAGNKEAYRRDYVLPVLAERVIYYDFFLHDPKTQASSLKVAQTFLERVKASPEHFEAIAKKEGLKTAGFTVSLREGLTWELEGGAPRPPASVPAMPEKVKSKWAEQTHSSDEGKRWIRDVIGPLRAGQVYPKVIDNGATWMIARYVRLRPRQWDVYEMQAVSFPKAGFQKWLGQESEKVKIH